MNNRRFFENPEFCAYISLLRELHRLIKAGDGETTRADELRDRMDGPSSKLDQEEIAVVNGISGEFYKLMEDRPEQLETVG